MDVDREWQRWPRADDTCRSRRLMLLVHCGVTLVEVISYSLEQAHLPWQRSADSRYTSNRLVQFDYLLHPTIYHIQISKKPTPSSRLHLNCLDAPPGKSSIPARPSRRTPALPRSAPVSPFGGAAPIQISLAEPISAARRFQGIRPECFRRSS